MEEGDRSELRFATPTGLVRPRIGPPRAGIIVAVVSIGVEEAFVWASLTIVDSPIAPGSHPATWLYDDQVDIMRFGWFSLN